ncbi:MAG TPA: NADH-quinone oxidoreductase subunit N [Gaiellaceae bacterium]|nr:NADH-quinone oxidoreductase subunit N [Gaiellaceae bacterium]
MIAAVQSFFARPHIDWFALAPVNTLLAAAALALLSAVLVPRRARKPVAATLSALGYAVAFGFAVALYVKSAHGHGVVADAFRRDRLTELAGIIVAGSGLLATAISYRERGRGDHVGEYYALLAAAGAGMLFFVGANNLMTLFLALEWFSISLYILCAIDRDRLGGLEAALKYLVVGGFGSAILLFGAALVYGATGAIGLPEIAAAGKEHDTLLLFGLAMIVAGLGFKASAAPFHMWTPDVYEGAPTPVTAFMSAATKTVALVVALRVLVTAFPGDADVWTVAVAVIAVCSLAIGNLAALVQKGVKRMLAYSSVSHAGFMLIAVSANSDLGGRALLYYLVPYAAMSLGSFAVVAARERELGVPVTFENMAGFGWERPLLGISMWAFMLGFAGFPLTGGFVGKFYAFAAAYRHGWTWLVIVGVIATLVSLYYYLGLVRAMFMRRTEDLQLAPRTDVRAEPARLLGGSPPRDALLQTAVVACLVVTVGSFFAMQPLIDLAKHASASLPF